MPKTFTSDIGMALPSAVEGPFLVVDPEDDANRVTLDPAGGGVTAGGLARPVRTLYGAFSRTSGSAVPTLIGTSLACRLVNTGLTGGYNISPVGVPPDADTNVGIDVSVVLGPSSDVTESGQVVRLELEATRVTPDGTVSNMTVVYDWPVPDDWMADDAALVMIDNGNGRTFDPGSLNPGDVLGLRIRRLGGDAADTFDQGLKVSDTLQLDYTARRL